MIFALIHSTHNITDTNHTSHLSARERRLDRRQRELRAPGVLEVDVVALRQGLAIVEEAEPAVAAVQELGRIGLECGVEPIARQLDAGLGAVAGVLHRHRVHRIAVRPTSVLDLAHHDVLQRASVHGPCSSSHMSEIDSYMLTLLLNKYDRWIYLACF